MAPFFAPAGRGRPRAWQAVEKLGSVAQVGTCEQIEESRRMG